MKEKVIAMLTSHDALKKDEHNGIPSRADLAAYLTDMFTKSRAVRRPRCASCRAAGRAGRSCCACCRTRNQNQQITTAQAVPMF